MPQYDAAAIGELLVDLSIAPDGTETARAGGAPCNVLAMLAGLGHSTAFLGSVGADAYGDFLAERAAAAGIDLTGLRRDPEHATTVAEVRNGADGDRSFAFRRDPGADSTLRASNVDKSIAYGCRVLCFGTLSMSTEPCRTAVRRTVRMALNNGQILAFDPNLRPDVFASEEDMRAAMRYGIGRCHILKLSEDELLWYTGCEDSEEAARKLLAESEIQLMFVTLGEKGSRAYCGAARAEAPACAVPGTVDTTGAGDCFFGAALHFILAYGWQAYAESELEYILRYANAAAALITTRRGALNEMPRETEILALMNGGN